MIELCEFYLRCCNRNFEGKFKNLSFVYDGDLLRQPFTAVNVKNSNVDYKSLNCSSVASVEISWRCPIFSFTFTVLLFSVTDSSKTLCKWLVNQGLTNYMHACVRVRAYAQRFLNADKKMYILRFLISKILEIYFTEMFCSNFVETSFVVCLLFCGDTGGICIHFSAIFVFKVGLSPSKKKKLYALMMIALQRRKMLFVSS